MLKGSYATALLCWLCVFRVAWAQESERRGVEAWMKVESPTGDPVSDMLFTVMGRQGRWRTDAEGQVNATVQAESDFVMVGQKRPAYPDLYIFGRAPPVSFKYTTFLGTRAEQRVLGQMIDVPYSRELGYIVVGMDVMEDPALG